MTEWRVLPTDLLDELLAALRRPHGLAAHGQQLDAADARDMTALATLAANVVEAGAFVERTETRGGRLVSRTVRLPRV